MKLSYDLLALDEIGTPNLSEFYGLSRTDIRNYSERAHFGISGIIIPGAEYPEVNIKGRKIQERCCGLQTYIPFHYVDILHNSKKWAFLGNDPARKKSLTDLLNNLVNDSNYKIIASFIDKKQLALSHGIFSESKLTKVRKIKPNLSKIASPREINLYEISLKSILSEFYVYLHTRKKRGIIIAEGRGEKEDKQLLDAFYMFQKEGAGSLSGKMVREHITDLLVIYKSQNHIGTQIADMICFPLYDNFILNHIPRSDHFIKKNSFENKIISLSLFPQISSDKKSSWLYLKKQKRG